MHPTRPNPASLLNLFCDAARAAERMEVREVASDGRFKFMSMRLAQHCHAAGDTAVARAVIDSALETSRRKRSPSTTRGKFIKRKATKKEIEKGCQWMRTGMCYPATLRANFRRKTRTRCITSCMDDGGWRLTDSIAMPAFSFLRHTIFYRRTGLL